VSGVTRDPEEPEKEGRRLDGRNLVEDWLRDKKGRGLKAQYIWNKRQLQRVDVTTLDHLLGEERGSELERKYFVLHAVTSISLKFIQIIYSNAHPASQETH
jgi:hypothetical protein